MIQHGYGYKFSTDGSSWVSSSFMVLRLLCLNLDSFQMNLHFIKRTFTVTVIIAFIL